MEDIRVFTRRTNYTPTDPLAFVGLPPFKELIPAHKSIEVSCTFTWDIQQAEFLKDQWEYETGEKVKIGGVAYKDPAGEYEPGRYCRQGITFTSRGCNNNCPWCIVPKVEGKIKEIEIKPGNVIQDNNFLQTSRAHKDKVFEMLKTQHAIEFRGGLEPDLIDDHFIQGIQGLRIHSLWLACDTDGALPQFKKACEKLTRAGLKRRQIRCYALSYGKDMAKDEARCRAIWEAGAMPFAQLYKDPEKDITYSKEWRAWQKQWQRPAIMKARMDGVKNEKI